MFAPPPLPLQTDRLTLRHLTTSDEDAAALFEFYSVPAVARYLLTEELSRVDVRDALRRKASCTNPQEAGDALGVGVVHDGTLIGDLFIQLTGEPLSVAEIGWVFHPAHGGQGFATESAGALIDLAFEHYRLHRVYADLDARNAASANLCERLGMTREMHARQDYWSKGEWTDSLRYAILRDDPRPWRHARTAPGQPDRLGPEATPPGAATSSH